MEKRASGKNTNFYIIDGQQRLTSLYKIIKEYPNQFITGDNLDAHYFPIRKKQSDQGIQQNFAFFFKYNANPSKDSYVYANRQLIKVHSKEWMKENGYIPLEYVFCPGNTLNSYLKKHKIESYKNKIINFKKKILKYELTLKQCAANWKMDEYRTVFTRLNNAGTNLSAFDECASILSIYKFNLHKKWRDISNTPKFNPIRRLDIDPMYLLKTMFIVGQIKRNDSNIRPPSLKNLKKYFKANESTEITAVWNDSVKYLNKACKRFIEYYGVRHKRLIPYTPMIVTLASTLYSFEKHTSHARYKQTFSKKIDWWYWSSVFSSQYSRGTDNKVALHVKKLIKWTHPTKSENSKWDGHTIDLKKLRAELGRLFINTDARYKGTLCLPLVMSKTDILNNDIEEFEDHHFFPKKRLEHLDINEHQINNVVNRIALDESSNRTINNIFPSEYKTQRKKIPIIPNCWKSYMIPDWVKDIPQNTKRTYLSFLRDRTDLIVEKINNVVKMP